MADREKEKRQARVASARDRVMKHASGFERTSLNVPEGVNFFNLKKPGVYRIDIMPYKVGKGNPYADEGTLHYERTFYVHRGIGPKDDAYVCLSMTFKKACPVCDHRKQLAQDPDADQKLIKSLKPSERQLFWVYDHDNPDRGVQLWDMSYFLFGDKLDKKIKNSDERDGYDTFHDPDVGYMLRIASDDKSMPGGKPFQEVVDIEFRKRDKPLSDKLWTNLPCLDDIPKELSYQKLKNILLQIDEPTDKEKEKAEDNGERRRPRDDDDERPKAKQHDDDDDPAPKKKQAESDDPTAEDRGIVVGTIVAHKKWGECKVSHISGDGTSLRLIDEDKEEHRGIAPIECKVLEQPKKKPARDDDDEPAPKKKAVPVEEDEDRPKKKAVREDDEDEAPRKKSAPRDDDDPPPKKKAAARDDDWEDE